MHTRCHSVLHERYKDKFYALGNCFLYAFWHSDKVKSLSGFNPAKSLTSPTIKGNICIKLYSLVKLWKAWIKPPLGDWNWLKKLKKILVQCSSHPLYNLTTTTSAYLRMLIILCVFKQLFNMALKWLFYLAEIRYDQLLTSYVLYPGAYHYGNRS